MVHRAGGGSFGRFVVPRESGVEVVMKIESTNPIRAFKGRGTWLAIPALAGEGRVGRDRPVVAASIGNFGQAVAFAKGEDGHLHVDGEDPLVATGAATIALKVTDAMERGVLPEIGTAYVPLGNGALIVGIGAWSGPGLVILTGSNQAAPRA
jgi:threonine dehydratase